MTEQHICQEYVHLLGSLYSKHNHIPPFVQTLLEHGRVMTAKHVPGVTGCSTLGQCFRNASLLAIESNLKYCEGYAMREGLIPMEHAWVIDHDGQVIDPTWDGNNEYFGVAIQEDFLIEFTHQTKFYGISPNLYLVRKDLPTVLDELRGAVVAI